MFFHNRSSRPPLGPARMLLVLAAVASLSAAALRAGLQGADSTASIIGAVGLILGLLGFQGQPSEPRSVQEVLPRLREDAGQRVEEEARVRGLNQRRYLPVRVTRYGTGQVTDDPVKTPPASWSARDFQRACRGWLEDAPRHRLVIYGGGGSGKTTIATMLSLSLLTQEDPDVADVPVPIMLSLASWQPSKESFETWLNRWLPRSYASIQMIEGTGPGGRAIRLLRNPGCILILDGLDELPQTGRASAIAQIDRFIPDHVGVVMLSRKSAPGSRPLLAGATQLEIVRTPPSTVASYLREQLPDEASGASLDALLELLEAPGHDRFKSLVAQPLYADLLRIGLAQGSITADLLLARADEEDRDKLADLLIHERIDTALRRIEGQHTDRSWRFLRYLALQLARHETRVLPWWRLFDLVPVSAVIAAGALFAAPAYVMALIMPAGLTRGLTIGVLAGIGFGLTRGMPVSVASVLPGLALCAGIVTVVGGIAGSWRDGAVDAIQIATAVSLSIASKDVLLTRRVSWDTLRRAVAISVAACAATLVTSRLLSASPMERGPLSMGVATLLGVAVATMSARLLIVNTRRMDPSTVVLSLQPRTEGLMQHVRSGVLTALGIGCGGGISGVLHFGLLYGAVLALVFGIVIGVPVGVSGGVVRWLSTPVDGPVKWTALSTVRADRWVAWATVACIGTGAAVAVQVVARTLPGPLALITQRSPFWFHPIDGALFGLTIGVVVACYESAWPTYLVAHVCLAVRGLLPWRLMRCLRDLREEGVLRHEGAYYAFRHHEYQRYLLQMPAPEKPSGSSFSGVRGDLRWVMAAFGAGFGGGRRRASAHSTGTGSATRTRMVPAGADRQEGSSTPDR